MYFHMVGLMCWWICRTTSKSRC